MKSATHKHAVGLGPNEASHKKLGGKERGTRVETVIEQIVKKPEQSPEAGVKPVAKAPRPMDAGAGRERAVLRDHGPGRPRGKRARLTRGISPHALYAAWYDWASHLANAPGRLLELGLEAVNLGARFARFATHGLSEDTKPTVPAARG